ncbi:membrane protein [Brevibacillus reuszeri]|uniref:tail protein X n=1 Tax=Brevibacillus reuszeri TaxID=54915 RepID=UPI001B1E563B|nr:tail protein X [Brevibacillus reuszeri]GIO09673.1 membrane protein [Brevibacillus reuszeri]
MPTKTYTTIQGDMWDTVAYRVYGNEYLMTDLIDANPRHRNIVVFPAGIQLSIPEIESPEPMTLPPWKRGGS